MSFCSCSTYYWCHPGVGGACC